MPRKNSNGRPAPLIAEPVADTDTAVADAASAGQLHPTLRLDWANGATFPQ